MAFTYTDYGKTMLHTWGRFRVTLLEAVVAGDLLHFYNTDASYTVEFADDSDDQRADCIACENGAAGDTIWACLAAECKASTSIGTGGAVTQNYFAASTDFFGAQLYLGESGKPSSTIGDTCRQEIGYLLARDRILLNPGIGLTDVQHFTWGSVVMLGHHFYMDHGYTVYIGASTANILYLGTSAGTVQFRCGTHGAVVSVDNDGLSTAYRIRTTGTLDFGPNHTGELFLPQRTEPITQPSEGTIWYNTTDDKVEFATAAGMEQVTSA